MRVDPIVTHREIGVAGESDEYGIRDAEVDLRTSMDTPFSDPEHTIRITGRETCCGALSMIFVSPDHARELAALLIKAAEEAAAK